MVITGIKRTRIIHELPPKRELVTPQLTRRVRILNSAGLSMQRIAAKLGVSKSIVARLLPERM